MANTYNVVIICHYIARLAIKGVGINTALTAVPDCLYACIYYTAVLPIFVKNPDLFGKT